MQTKPYYESKAALEQYLFFHYGPAREYLPFPGPADALNYPSRALELLLDAKRLPRKARGLDLGCAVGRTSFELSRFCRQVIGIDLSRSFIRAAKQLRKSGKIPLRYTVEGDIKKSTILRIPRGSKPQNITFQVGDAREISGRAGTFDVAVLLNLIDRLPDPAACLRNLTDRLNPGAQLIIASPYTWMEQYTPRSKWLGGRPGSTSFEALQDLLGSNYKLIRRKQIPFLIREHSRKYQWSVAEGIGWIKGP